MLREQLYREIDLCLEALSEIRVEILEVHTSDKETLAIVREGRREWRRLNVLEKIECQALPRMGWNNSPSTLTGEDWHRAKRKQAMYFNPCT